MQTASFRIGKKKKILRHNNNFIQTHQYHSIRADFIQNQTQHRVEFDVGPRAAAHAHQHEEKYNRHQKHEDRHEAVSPFIFLHVILELRHGDERAYQGQQEHGGRQPIDLQELVAHGGFPRTLR